MKKFLIIFILSFGLGLLLISFITYARQTKMSTYYPSPSGNYTKVHLINQGGGVDENSATAPFCLQTVNGYDTTPISGHTYVNAGTIFADPSTGYLEICKSDGSVASYPGSCFNRFADPGTTPACPSNYTVTNGSSTSPNFGNAITSWSCCFTGQGSTAGAPISKSGCFSIYATATTPTTFPASCSSQDPNAYDVGCDAIYSSDMTAPVYKRNCCFNTSSGANALGVSSTCCTPVDGSWSGWSACSDGTQIRTCTAPSCGGANCSGASSKSCCKPVDGGWGAWYDWLTCGQSFFPPFATPGFSDRFRPCDNPSPACGGKLCEGYNREIESCVTVSNEVSACAKPYPGQYASVTAFCPKDYRFYSLYSSITAGCCLSDVGCSYAFGGPTFNSCSSNATGSVSQTLCDAYLVTCSKSTCNSVTLSIQISCNKDSTLTGTCDNTFYKNQCFTLPNKKYPLPNPLQF